MIAPLIRLMSRRSIVSASGLKIFLDPATHLGQTVMKTGAYEPETIRIFRDHIRSGDTVLDIGANEGFFSALAQTLAGPSGRVVAIEPQSRLQDVIEINLALNPGASSTVIKAIMGEEDGASTSIYLFPSSNSGASSVVRPYRLSTKREDVSVRTPSSVAEQLGIQRFDFVKVDVEGFEPEVVRALGPLIAQRRVGKLLLDYHGTILRDREVNPQDIHDLLIQHGMVALEGEIGVGYVLYEIA
jgi:FkbM family methyltransferase